MEGNCSHVGVACTPDQLADDDWWRWRGSLNKYLPGGTIAKIDESQAGAMQRFDISLRWAEIGSKEKVSYTLSIQL